MAAPRLPFSKVTADWSDKPLYVIGGGPSLEGFDFDQLRPLGRLLGCNKSAFRADCDALVSIDQHFARMHSQDIRDFVKQGKEAYLALPASDDRQPIEGVTYLLRRRDDGLSPDPRELRGVHTGYAALNLAFLAGAKEIALLGLDMNYSKEGRSHWHDSYPWQSKNSVRFYERWSRNFARAAQQLAQEGVQVTTFGPTKITEFPNRSLSDVA